MYMYVAWHYMESTCNEHVSGVLQWLTVLPHHVVQTQVKLVERQVLRRRGYREPCSVQTAGYSAHLLGHLGGFPRRIIVCLLETSNKQQTCLET